MQNIRSIRKRVSRYLRNRVLRKDIILVYTMGKVGSSTIQNTIKHYYPEAIVFQPHFLSDTYINNQLKESNHYEKNFQVAQTVKSTLKKYPNNRIKLISIVRDPISRDISNIFQNPVDFIGNNSIDHYNVNELIKIYKEKEKHYYTLHWFDDEFKHFTNLDIFDFPFNKQSNYSIITTEKFDLLLIKMEHLNTMGVDVINSFLNLKLPSLLISNTGEGKSSNAIQKEFKQKYIPDTHTLNSVYNSKLVQHFYSQHEIEAMKNKWLKK